MFGLGAWGYWYMNVRNARLHFEQALSFYEQKEYRTAVMKIGFALEYDRAYADAFLLRAKINSEHFRNYFKAIEDYNWAIEGKRGALSQAELYYRRGWCYFKMYDFEVALEDFERAIKLDNANPRYRFFRAAMQAKTEAKSDRLCADLEGGLQIQIPEASEYLGMYCSKAQDKDNKRDTIQ
jgi:tetratricopeptide (TPR) repeat protein